MGLDPSSATTVSGTAHDSLSLPGDKSPAGPRPHEDGTQAQGEVPHTSKQHWQPCPLITSPARCPQEFADRLLITQRRKRHREHLPRAQSPTAHPSPAKDRCSERGWDVPAAPSTHLTVPECQLPVPAPIPLRRCEPLNSCEPPLTTQAVCNACLAGSLCYLGHRIHSP